MSSSCLNNYPSVANGLIREKVYNTSVEYECLSGFQMNGNKTIYCQGGTWGNTPTCTVITSNNFYVSPDWWLILIAVLLGLLLLSLICFFLWYCCCRGCCGYNAVHPYRNHSRSACCSCCRGRDDISHDTSTDLHRYHTLGHSPADTRNGVYFIPVRPMEAGQSRNTTPVNSKTTFYGKKTQTLGTQTAIDSPRHSEDYRSWKGNDNTTRTFGTQTAKESSTPPLLHIDNTSPKTWKDTANSQEQLNLENENMAQYHWDKVAQSIKPERRAKAVHAWMPHSHPVRPINTSTK